MSEIFNGENCNSIMERSVFPSECPPAMAYVPYQKWDNVYEVSTGFNKGTIFPVLDKPFTGKRGDVK